MRIDDNLSISEMNLIEQLKQKNRMDVDEIISHYEGDVDNG